MAKTRLVKFKITGKQYEDLISRTRASNNISMAAYLRQLTFDQPMLYDKTCENNKLIRELISYLSR